VLDTIHRQISATCCTVNNVYDIALQRSLIKQLTSITYG